MHWMGFLPDPPAPDPPAEHRKEEMSDEQSEYPIWVHAFYDQHTGTPREATKGELEEAAEMSLPIERFSVAPAWDFNDLGRQLRNAEDELEAAQEEIDRLRGYSDSAEDQGPE